MGQPDSPQSQGASVAQAASPATPKRSVRPEEQSLLDELEKLQEQYGEQFPNIIKYVQKGTLSSVMINQVESDHLRCFHYFGSTAIKSCFCSILRVPVVIV